MRIVIDMQGAQTESRFRGIGRYTLSFALAVVHNRGEHEVFLALSGLFPETIEPIRSAFDGILPQENIKVWYADGPVREMESGNEERRRKAELIREAFLASLRPDVVHISSLFEGFEDDAVTSVGRFDRSTPVSLALYDLIPFLNEDYYLTPNPPYAAYYYRKMEHLKKADRYLTISEFAKEEGVLHLPVPSERFVNISTAVGPEFRQIEVEETSKLTLFRKFGLTRPFILCTGGADERKNLPRLIEAFSYLPPEMREEHQLLFAGKLSDNQVSEFNDVARTFGLKREELKFAGYISDLELLSLYNLCKLYVFPSWHEGFGLPALEAMACGAPVIASNTSSLPEVVGLEVAQFDPFDPWAISTKISRALGSSEFRDRLIVHGAERAKLFSWDRTAKTAISAWEELHSNKARSVEILDQRESKLKLAYVSPLPPERTGIAGYSEDILPALSEYYDIEVVTFQEETTKEVLEGPFNVRTVDWLLEHQNEIDRVVYQVGNSPFHSYMLNLMEEVPGTVVMHDFYLSGLLWWLENVAREEGVWAKALYSSHGYPALIELGRNEEDAKKKYPSNLTVLEKAKGVVVHSEYSRSLAKEWYPKLYADEWEVIPLVRKTAYADSSRKASARKTLGLPEDDFVICSFGFLDYTKLNHRLIDCWLQSDLSSSTKCRLVFVGENHGGEYGQGLVEKIENSGFGDKICITGYVSKDDFQNYLAAADAAVQLRTLSRGETSAAVLDCMNYGLPLIINGNGSSAEVDSTAVSMLPDEFEDVELISALNEIWQNSGLRKVMGDRSAGIIRTKHAPEECAFRYAQAIEKFSKRDRVSLDELALSLMSVNCEERELISLSKKLAATFPASRPCKRIFLDVSATHNVDHKSGIERVVYALMNNLLRAASTKYRVEPVYLSETEDGWGYRYARQYTLDFLGLPSRDFSDELIAPENGDLILGLDVSGDSLIRAEHSGMFKFYRNAGVSIYFMVHDLLPVTLPEVFPPGTKRNHEEWLTAISRFDGAICVSETVAKELSAWLESNSKRNASSRSFKVTWSHHGADFVGTRAEQEGAEPSKDLPGPTNAFPTFLMVGTIEPRKGYLQALEAFTALWRKGIDVNLVIVGREGWKQLPDSERRDIPETVERLRNHPELNNKLFWLEGISDSDLEEVYGAASCLLTTSYGEGFGLPLIEAAQKGLPIMARDIEVFREVAGQHAYYFEDGSVALLEKSLNEWLKLYEKELHPSSSGMPWLTWRASADNLLRVLVEETSTESEDHPLKRVSSSDQTIGELQV